MENVTLEIKEGFSDVFIDVDTISESSLQALGPNSILGDHYDDKINWYNILIYACILNLPGLGEVYILERGQDFIMYKKVPDSYQETTIYELFKFEQEMHDAQISFDEFKRDHYARHFDTGLNIMRHRYEDTPAEITEYVPYE